MDEMMAIRSFIRRSSLGVVALLGCRWCRTAMCRQSPEENPGSDVLRNERSGNTSHYNRCSCSFVLETTQAVVLKHELRMREKLQLVRILTARARLDDLNAQVQSI